MKTKIEPGYYWVRWRRPAGWTKEMVHGKLLPVQVYQNSEWHVGEWDGESWSECGSDDIPEPGEIGKKIERPYDPRI